MRIFRWVWLAAAVAWFAILAFPIGPLPALGPLLDFQKGVWNHHDFQWANHTLPGLHMKVDVAIDGNGVPHIFAENENDLYFAQGYIMASQRLFQMDLSTRSTMGRLSELVGAKGLPMDRFFVRFGMRQSVMQTVNKYLENPQMAAMLNAYTTGVNYYIKTLKELPVEYKLLGKTPEMFDPSRIVAMARALTFSLDGGSDDYVQSHVLQQIPIEKVLDLFPEFHPREYSDYVLPGPWSAKTREPEKPEMFKFRTHIKNFPAIPTPSKSNGSNNWVVGPQKSKTGHSILANDTHLGFSLPNVWFENQLITPTFNVYGVSLPDTPGVVAGFTQSTAWGYTNGSTDALDYYEVEFADESSNTYIDKGHGVEAQVFHEVINVSNQAPETVDVVWTKWGPVLYREGKYGLIANWAGFKTKQELLAIRKLYNTKTAKECLQALDDWNVPLQNAVCADADHIGIRHAGFVPKRAIGEGRFIEAAGDSEHALQDPIDPKFTLMREDPKEGYLRSANERVADQTYPYYLGWDYPEPFRGMRIKHLLESQDKFSGEDLIAIQDDNYDTLADFTLPYMLKSLTRDKLTDDQRQWVGALEKWDRHVLTDSAEPTLFREWYNQVRDGIFADEYSIPEQGHYYPQNIRIGELLKRVSENPDDSDSQWVDDKRTPEKETLSMIVDKAFQGAWSELTQAYGPNPKAWVWKKFINTRIPHIAKLPGFGSEQLSMNGAGESVFSNRGWHGPVYKAVIELGPEPHAWMQVPGGTNGDPLSPDFTHNVLEWAAGEMHKVEYYKSLIDAKAHAVKLIVLSPGEG